MPGMRLCGRRCSLATDDFFAIGLIDFIFYLPCLGWLPVVYASFLKNRLLCTSDHTLLLLNISLPGLCLSFLANWIIGVLFMIFSTRGTIAQPEPRRHVVTVVYMKLIITVFDVAWAILGTVILYRNCFCNIISVPLAIKICTIILWVAIVARVLLIITFYDWNFAKKKTKESIPKEYFSSPVRKNAFKRWSIRMQGIFLWCTTPSETRRQAVETASELLAILSYDLDLVVSDVFAGFLMFRQKCLIKYRAERAAMQDAPPIAAIDGTPLERFPSDDIPSWMNLQLGTRYLRIGLGIFGWQWYMMTNLACGVCTIMSYLTCCLPCRKQYKMVLGDNCCGCSLAGLQASTELQYEDLVHVNFVNKIYEVPFYVSYDHETSAVLITVRGTMSMNDVLTDLTAGFEKMDDPGVPAGGVCHGGMLSAAREIKKQLDKNGILDKVFQAYPDYQLITTGHSLGASVASILCVLLRSTYPGIRCYAFSPCPTMNMAVVSSTYSNIFTLMYRNDFVAYMNYENVNGLVTDIITCLKECDVPKHKVFMKNGKVLDTNVEKEISNCKAESKRKNISNGSAHKENEFVNIDIEKNNECRTASEKLLLAGTILHIWPYKNEYRLRLTTSEFYKPLSVRPNLFLDHYPKHIQDTLKDLGKEPTLEAASIKACRTRK